MSCSLVLKNISFKKNYNIIFENINLNVGHKEKIAIFGENGIGKSTLLEICAGLIKPSSGEIELFHKNVNEAKEYQKFRHLVGYLFQNSLYQFICPKVFEDIAFSLLSMGCEKQEAKKRVELILEELNITHLKEKIVYNLSGGEQKLVALAGVLVTSPHIMLLDEPTNALDSKMQEKLTNIISKINKSIIIVSHDENFVKKVAQKTYKLTKNGLKPT